MAIDPLRGLPSFSEMYNAYKNRGGLGQALQGGIDAYTEGRAAKSKENLQSAEAEKNRADAKHYATPKSESFVRLDQISDPAEKAALAQYASPDAQGVMTLPISTYNAVTKRSQGQEAIDLKNQLAQAQAERNQQLAEKDRALQKVAEEKASLQAQLSPVNQTINAAKDLASSAATVDAPTPIGRLGSLLKEKVLPPALGGGTPTSAVAAERQGEAARTALQGIVSHTAPTKLNTVDQAIGITPDPLETKAVQILNDNHKPVTPANIAEVKRRLGDKRGSK